MTFDLGKGMAIKGWMSNHEMTWLYQMASTMDTVIEIGAWCGRSTYALCCGAKMVYSIDNFKGVNHHEMLALKAGLDVVSEYYKNTAEFQNHITIIADSATAAQWLSIKADMVFIDGAHDYTSITQDLTAWAPRARKMVCGHDTQIDTVKEAIGQYFGTSKPELIANTSIWAKKIAT